MSITAIMYIPEESKFKLDDFWIDLRKRYPRSRVLKKDVIEILLSGYKNPDFNEGEFFKKLKAE